MRTFGPLTAALVLALTGMAPAQTVLDLSPPTGSEPAAALEETADFAAILGHFQSLDRISADLAQHQSVAILGHIYGWEAPSHDNTQSYNSALMHAISGTEIEAVDARRGIERNPAASELDLIAVRGIDRDMRRLRATSAQVLEYLFDGRVADAAALYQSETVPLRQQIQHAALTAVTLTRERLSAAP
ncbi:hypothetical protein HKCCE2091_13915 [Rhodobacterales bacterium HKCCE2091]|nr:hypothetical protein [Rhodobacterales bacterium HKCCE2091]